MIPGALELSPDTESDRQNVTTGEGGVSATKSVHVQQRTPRATLAEPSCAKEQGEP